MHYDEIRSTREFAYFYFSEGSFADSMFERLNLIAFYNDILPYICNKVR